MDAATVTERMPAVFIGPGNPMNAFDPDRLTTAWSTPSRDHSSSLRRSPMSSGPSGWEQMPTAGERAVAMVDWSSTVSLAMVSYGSGIDQPPPGSTHGAAAQLPHDMPPESTNL